jgi:sulfatase modifying factor 1
MRAFAGGVVACSLVACAAPQRTGNAPSSRCPPEMVLVDTTGDPAAHGHSAMTAVPRAYCVDRWEASLVETTPEGERAFSPFENPARHKVRAVSRPGVVPQAYISRNEAEGACRASQKRLCEESEWVRACEGSRRETFPYGPVREAGYCNDHGKPPLASLYPDNAHTWEAMNDPRLNQQPESVAKTGAFARCESPDGAFDMVGNVHEWVADPGGTFCGGYYLDTTLNGSGCHYETVAHDAAYHDYSTGFRCCADAR